MTTPYDILIRNVDIVDGSGGDTYRGDVAVDGAVIADLGDLSTRRAQLDIDGSGLCLAPGFIDVHTHDDFAVINHPDMAFKARGGVTTCVVGNCGFGAAPFEQGVQMLSALAPGPAITPYVGHAGYATTIERLQPGVNIAVLAGHGTLRLAAMGNADRAPEEHELDAMKSMLDEALAAGVFGLSSGLIYEPGRYADTDELAEVCSVMAGTGALYATHLRDEGPKLLDAVSEAIEIGARAEVPVQISHLKASGRDNWGSVRDALKLIDQARNRDQEVHADQYPYTAGSTSLQAIVDNGAFIDGIVPSGIGTVSADDVIIAAAPGEEQDEGLSIADIASREARPAREAALDFLARAPLATCVIHMMCEDDVRTVMQHDRVMIGSDGLPTLDGKPHPRLYNTFARVLGHYARDHNVFDIATAVHRMTGLPAAKLGLTDRGTVAVGARADLVLFNADRIIDRGTFEQPNQYPTGIHLVIVNGVVTVRDDTMTGTRGGMLLTRER